MVKNYPPETVIQFNINGMASPHLHKELKLAGGEN